jgi:hypothetical protein
MSVIKIFNREQACKHCCPKTGLINIVDLLYVPHIDIKHIGNIITSFVCDKEFLSIVNIARKICNLPMCNMAVYCYFSNDIWRCWYLHPILIKSVLRHIDELLDKCTIARIVYEVGNDIDLDIILTCSLLFIVENVEQPKIIKRSYGPSEYKCDGIKNRSDMFNDDHLVKEYINYVMIEFLPQCLCDIICSMVL